MRRVRPLARAGTEHRARAGRRCHLGTRAHARERQSTDRRGSYGATRRAILVGRRAGRSPNDQHVGAYRRPRRRAASVRRVRHAHARGARRRSVAGNHRARRLVTPAIAVATLSRMNEIDALLQEHRRFPPPDEFRRNAIVGDEKIYDRATRDPEEFWAQQARELHWFTPWKTICEWKPPHAKWFIGGTLNVSYNCIDRH